MKTLPSGRRAARGVTLVEVAITAPITFLLLIGLIVGSLGTFRYQQVATLAREGATYASNHGPYYQSRYGFRKATSETVLSNVIIPLAAGLDTSALHCTLTYDTSANTATVKLDYDWLPEGLLPATKLSSTSVMPIEQ
jgi:Flp pilus assembly protein TadG